jgi:drug/metabolite transporter (DMT)-like permease
MFGTWPIVGKVALRGISATSLVALRVAGAAIGFAFLQRRLGQIIRLPRRDFTWLALCSVLGVSVNQLLYVKGLSLTTAINATLLSTAIPVFTLLISIILGYDRLSWRRAMGILLAAAGVIYLVDPLRADFSSHTTLGNLLIVANSLCYGAYIAISKNLFKRYGALNVITWMFALACIVTLPAALIGAKGNITGPADAHVWLAVGYTIIVPTLLAYYLNAWSLTRVMPSTVATYIYLQPLIAFGLAPLVLGERWSMRTTLACIMVFSGVAIVTSRRRSHAAIEVTERPDALAH